MDMAPGLPPIKPKTCDMALNSLPSDFETYDLAPASLPPSDTETYDLAPAGPLPSGKDLRLTSPGMHEERRQDAGMQAVRWELARSCWRVLRGWRDDHRLPRELACAA